MTRSNKILGTVSNNSQPRSPTFETFSAVAVAVLFLFLYLQNHSLAGDSPPPDPQGSWKQVHQILGISLGASSATRRKPALVEPLSKHNPPLRLAGPGRNPKSSEDKAELLQDLAEALRSISRKTKQRE